MADAPVAWRRLARWVAGGVTAFPVAVLSHELGHWILACAFGFPVVRLHYGSSSYATADEFWRLVRQGDRVAAAAIHPLWQPATVAAGGLVVSVVTPLVACLLVRRHGPRPFVVALGLIASIRFVGGIPLLLARALGRARNPGSDESHLALVSHVPESLLIVAGIGCLVGSWWYLLATFRGDERRHTRRAVLAGIVLGGAVYIGVLGPLLLP